MKEIIIGFGIGALIGLAIKYGAIFAWRFFKGGVLGLIRNTPKPVESLASLGEENARK